MNIFVLYDLSEENASEISNAPIQLSAQHKNCVCLKYCIPTESSDWCISFNPLNEDFIKYLSLRGSYKGWSIYSGTQTLHYYYEDLVGEQKAARIRAMKFLNFAGTEDLPDEIISQIDYVDGIDRDKSKDEIAEFKNTLENILKGDSNYTE